MLCFSEGGVHALRHARHTLLWTGRICDNQSRINRPNPDADPGLRLGIIYLDSVVMTYSYLDSAAIIYLNSTVRIYVDSVGNIYLDSASIIYLDLAGII